MYSTINNEKYELTMENIFEIHRQEDIQTAKTMLECQTEMTAEEIENIDEEILLDMADDYKYLLYADEGDNEREIVRRYGFEED